MQTFLYNLKVKEQALIKILSYRFKNLPVCYYKKIYKNPLASGTRLTLTW